MSKTILLADDSQTIQKVISITLANCPWKLDIVNNESDLVENYKNNQYDLLLLDFELSKAKSGFELARLLKEISQKTKILILFGTFDTIDESLIKKNGIDDYIVKPFDGHKFVESCKNLIENFHKKNGSSIQENSGHGDNWELSETSKNLKRPEGSNISSSVSPQEEMKSWGIEVPNVIDDEGNTDKAIEKPPVIEAQSTTPQDAQSADEDGPVIPNSEDLEYPDVQKKMDNIKGHITLDKADDVNKEDSSPSEKLEDIKLSSKLIPMDDLNLSNEEDEKANNSKILNSEHRPEIEELKSSEDFWSVDDSESKEGGLLDDETIEFKIDEEQLEEIKRSAKELEQKSFQNDRERTSAIDSQIRGELTEKMRPLIQEMIKKEFKDTIEKIAWEIIPDLAENLIREELSKISESVQSQN